MTAATNGRITVPDTSFDLECDRLSHVVDDAQFERLRWARTEGPMLARLVALAEGALEERSDFALVEEGTSRDDKRFTLKVHGNRVVTVVISLDGNRAVMRVEEAERSRYRVLSGEPVSAEFALVDEAWIASALQQLFSRIQSLA